MLALCLAVNSGGEAKVNYLLRHGARIRWPSSWKTSPTAESLRVSGEEYDVESLGEGELRRTKGTEKEGGRQEEAMCWIACVYSFLGYNDYRTDIFIHEDSG